METKHRIRLLLLALSLAAIAILPYVGILDNYFSAPDTLAQIYTSRVRSVGDVVRIFSEPMLSGTTATEAVLWYRPVAILTQSIDYAVWGLNPFGFHLTDLALNTLVVLLTLWFVNTVTRRIAVAWVAAALFALHPVLVEVVPAIARRHDALAMVFMYAALILFVESQRAGGHFRLKRLLSWLALALALGAKEIAAILPVILLAYVAMSSPPAGRTAAALRSWARRSLRPVFPYFIIVVLYVAWRALVLHGLGGDLHAPPVAWGEIIRRYFAGLLDPQGFAASKVPGWAVVAAWLASLGWLFGRFGRPEHRQACGIETAGRQLGFFAVWLLLPLAVMLVTSSFALRRVYVAVIPLCAIISLVGADALSGLRRGKGWRRLADAVMAAVLILVGTGILFYSPLVRAYPEWEQSAAFSRLFFDRFSVVVETLPSDAHVRIEGLPRRFPKPADRPAVVAEGWLTGHAIESWVRLTHPDLEITVRLGSRPSLERPPDDLIMETRFEADKLVIIDVKPVFL